MLIDLGFLFPGKNSLQGRGIYRYSTAAALEEPIKPPVSVEYSKLLINGQFVDAASGEPFFFPIIYMHMIHVIHLLSFFMFIVTLELTMLAFEN